MAKPTASELVGEFTKLTKTFGALSRGAEMVEYLANYERNVKEVEGLVRNTEERKEQAQASLDIALETLAATQALLASTEKEVVSVRSRAEAEASYILGAAKTEAQKLVAAARDKVDKALQEKQTIYLEVQELELRNKLLVSDNTALEDKVATAKADFLRSLGT